MEKTLGIIAGQGQFPFQVAQGAVKQGYRVVSIGYEGNTDPSLGEEVDQYLQIKLGKLSKMIDFFKKQQAKEVVFAGAIDKPNALQIRPDLRVMKLALSLKSLNDSALLGAVCDELRNEGIVITSPLAFVPELMVDDGLYTKRKPSSDEVVDIEFGWSIAKELGKLDIGQCLVINKQMVVAVEAMEGTNSTIARAGSLLKNKGGVVIKVFKPGQEEYVDQPSIGLKTIECMAEYGLTCLVVEAGKSLFFDKEESIALANKKKITLLGRK